MEPLFPYIIIVSLMLSSLPRSVPGRSPTLAFFVIEALQRRPPRRCVPVLLGSRCGWKIAGLKL